MVMVLLFEPLLCPCCTPALLYALAQSGVRGWSQPLLMVGSGALEAAISLKGGVDAVDRRRQCSSSE